MKKFLINIIIFTLPLTIFLIEGFLPINTFTYRPWEAMLYTTSKDVAFPFYPNQDLKMLSMGDLLHHTENTILKKENWITDELGYRNDTFIKKPKILLIGDSFIAGSSLPQDSTLTNLLNNKLDTEVYNLAPAIFNDFISLLNNQIINKPELVVFSIVERNTPQPILKGSHGTINQNISNTSIFKDKLVRLYSLKYIEARIKKEHGHGIPGKDSIMYFLNGENQENNFEKIHEIARTIISYKNYCDSIGINFIFLPLPNKETVYFDRVPLSNQPAFIFKLDSILEINGVTTINTLALFNNEKENKYTYHLDDTHWNSFGVNLVANELRNKIRTFNLFE